MGGELSRDKEYQKIQGFAPRKIETISAGAVDVSTWLGFCFPEVDATYQLEGAGPVVTVAAGTVRVVHETIASITFSGFVTAKCEIM